LTAADGKDIELTGFAFAPATMDTPRTISPHKTAEMALIYNIMSTDYSEKGFEKQAEPFQKEGIDCLKTLGDMTLTLDTPQGQVSFLPDMFLADLYARDLNPDSIGIGSIDATAYTIFAFNGYNPYALGEKLEVLSRRFGSDASVGAGQDSAPRGGNKGSPRIHPGRAPFAPFSFREYQ
jgi:hypothetical protein